MMRSRKRVRVLKWIATVLTALTFTALIASHRWTVWCNTGNTVFYLGWAAISCWHRDGVDIWNVWCVDHGWSLSVARADFPRRAVFPHFSVRNGLSISLPLAPLGLLLSFPTVFLWDADLRRRIPPGHCKKCGYDLTGNTSGVCPECGRPCKTESKPAESGS